MTQKKYRRKQNHTKKKDKKNHKTKSQIGRSKNKVSNNKYVMNGGSICSLFTDKSGSATSEKATSGKATSGKATSGKATSGSATSVIETILMTSIYNKTKYGPLNRSSRYIYELTTYVRNPATLLQAVELNGTSTPRTNGKLTPPTYTYVPYNVNNPYGLLTGTNPKKSGDEFVTQYGFDQLEFAEITGIDYINVDLKSPSPSINNLKANVFNSKNVDLTWSVNGDQSNISHFILRRQNVETGKLDLIGKAHGINTQNNYLFTDTIRYTDSGVFKYIITMQYFNLNLGPDYTSNEVVI
jgi:hypothetical protein